MEAPPAALFEIEDGDRRDESSLARFSSERAIQIGNGIPLGVRRTARRYGKSKIRSLEARLYAWRK
jgi:hypothetical protein